MSELRPELRPEAPITEDDGEHLILVAFSVFGVTRSQAELRLHAELLEHPVSASDSPIESWWVAEDDRRDGSDNGSAVFCAKGFQARASRLLEQHAMAEAWNITPLERCADCGAPIRQINEKALASGQEAIVWADEDSAWVCPITSNEHRPIYRKEQGR
jgi:hypothetical protein